MVIKLSRIAYILPKATIQVIILGLAFCRLQHKEKKCTCDIFYINAVYFSLRFANFLLWLSLKGYVVGNWREF